MTTTDRPLEGRRVVVTRASDHAAALAAPLRELGAEVIELATTRIERLDARTLREAIANIRDYGWVVFTSRNAVRIFWDELCSLGLDASALTHARIAVVGPATAAAVEERGMHLELAPERFVAEGLLEAMSVRRDVAGTRMLYPVAEGAREILFEGLRAIGASVDAIRIYRSVPVSEPDFQLRERLIRGEIDVVTVAAPSAVAGLLAAVGVEAALNTDLVSIGPVTTRAAFDEGLAVAAEAETSTMAGLVQAVLRVIQGGRAGSTCLPTAPRPPASQ